MEKKGYYLLARTYPFCELNGGESTASSMERRGIEATPFGGRGGGVVHGWWSKRGKNKKSWVRERKLCKLASLLRQEVKFTSLFLYRTKD